ncbi:MAG: hypothetical protein IPP48_03470 [Chitinophagaceae bacterium]|nr:hypothetical protein [Chitinophagaceae bacterium]
MANKDTVKQWFETGDLPTQAQFYQKFDWLRWQDEKIVFADLSPELQAHITAISGVLEFDGAVHSWTFPAGTLIDRVVVIDATDINFSMGTTLGGTNIFDNALVEVADTQTGILTSPYYCVDETTIYWSGNGVNSKIKIYKS